MIKIAEISNPRIAQSFVDYMAKKKIVLAIAPSNDHFAIWLKDESYSQMVIDEYSQFATDPMHPKYSQASWDMAESRNARFHYHAPSFGQMLKERAGPITLLMMGLCAAVFFFQVLGRHGQVFAWLHFPSSIEQSYQVWRWFTHADYALFNFAYRIQFVVVVGSGRKARKIAGRKATDIGIPFIGSDFWLGSVLR